VTGCLQASLGHLKAVLYQPPDVGEVVARGRRVGENGPQEIAESNHDLACFELLWKPPFEGAKGSVGTDKRHEAGGPSQDGRKPSTTPHREVESQSNRQRGYKVAEEEGTVVDPQQRCVFKGNVQSVQVAPALRCPELCNSRKGIENINQQGIVGNCEGTSRQEGAVQAVGLQEQGGCSHGCKVWK